MEFAIMQHCGGGQDIPQMTDVNESTSKTAVPSEMSDSVVMDIKPLRAHGEWLDSTVFVFQINSVYACADLVSRTGSATN